MIAPACDHSSHQKDGKTRRGEQRYRCNLRGHVWFDAQLNVVGSMRIPVDSAKTVLRLLVEGMSIRASERTTGVHRDTLCFSKKLLDLEAAVAMFASYYNFCWQNRKPGKSGQKRPTAAVMAKIGGHVWSFDELFAAVPAGPTQS